MSATIGILQFIPQLEDAAWGFMGAVRAASEAALEFRLLEAEGETARCPGLARELVDAGCEVLFGCAIPAAEALKEAAALSGRPVLFAPVFHPVLSGLVESEQRPGGQVTGVAGRLDPERKLDAVARLFPSPGEVTLVADAAEPSSLWEARSLAEAWRARGVQVEIQEVADGRPVPARQGRLHLLTFAPALEETLERWIEPFFAAAAPVVGSGARAGFLGCVMAVFADHGELGRLAGGMAAEILRGRPAGDLPVRYPESVAVGVNYGAAGRLGIPIPVPLGQVVDIL